MKLLERDANIASAMHDEDGQYLVSDNTWVHRQTDLFCPIDCMCLITAACSHEVCLCILSEFMKLFTTHSTVVLQSYYRYGDTIGVDVWFEDVEVQELLFALVCWI